MPDFGTGVVRRASLGVKHAILGYLTDIEIAHFVSSIAALENIGRFEISVEDVSVVQGFQAGGHLAQCIPDIILRKLRRTLLMLNYLLI